MSLHAKQMALAAGAAEDEVAVVAARMIEDGRITTQHAAEVLAALRGAQ